MTYDDAIRWLNAAALLNACFWLTLSLIRRGGAVITPRTEIVGWGYVFALFMLGYLSVDSITTGGQFSHRAYGLTLIAVVSNATILYRFKDDL